MSSRKVVRLRIAIGVLLGLIASAVVLSVFDGAGGGPAGPRRGPLLSDCDGPIRELAVHYVAEAAGIVAPTYGDFFRQLPAGVTVFVVCPEQADFDDLRARVGATQCVLSPVVVSHAITPWARDRWLALAPAEPTAATTLLAPRGEEGADVWPARAGDQRVGNDLAAVPGLAVVSVRSDLCFDGGDFVADTETVFVTPNVLRRNLQQTVRTREELVEQLSTQLQRRVVLLDVAPDHHAGMYMMAVGDRTVLVGDPTAAQRLLAEAGERATAESAEDATTESVEDVTAQLCPPDGPDFSASTVARFDAVARQCEAAGYRVERIPIVPGRNGRTYVTYLNVILDQRDGHRTVYLPTFSHAEVLNRAAAQVWAKLGYEVRPVNCDACYTHFGSLRCLVNVLRRG